MVLAAVEDPDPVFIFENAILYGIEGELEENGVPDVWKAAVRREGRTSTVVTYSASVWKALEAAEQLAAEGIEAEVIDLRSLRPLDMETVLASLAKTHRAVIVDEGWRTGSIAAEVSAQIMERGFDLLDWPVQRVCSAEIPMPYAKHLEDAALPNAERDRRRRPRDTGGVSRGRVRDAGTGRRHGARARCSRGASSRATRSSAATSSRSCTPTRRTSRSRSSRAA